jgi:RHS repeat-associated protein
LTNGSGAILNSYTYDIWGSPKSMTENMPNPFRYSGELWDSKTELQYLRARWYDPSVGRFISQDTFEGDAKNPLSLNLYTYVENNPLKYIDPTGHAPNNPLPETPEEFAKIWIGMIDFVGGPIKVVGKSAISGIKSGWNAVVGFFKGTDNVLRLSDDGIRYALSNQSRLQHAFKHAKDLGFGNWNRQTEVQWKNYIGNILNTSSKSFDNMLGNDKVKGFYKLVDGNHVAVYIFKEGKYQGQVATVVKLTENQLKKFDLK